MSDLKPMVLMVCGPCREQDGPRLVCGEPACAFSDYENGDPAKPARSRDEMVEGAARMLARDFGHEQDFTRESKAASYGANYWRTRASRCLSAAIPGLLED